MNFLLRMKATLAVHCAWCIGVLGCYKNDFVSKEGEDVIYMGVIKMGVSCTAKIVILNLFIWHIIDDHLSIPFMALEGAE